MEPGSAWYKVLNNDDRVLDFFHAVLRLASDNVIEDVEKRTAFAAVGEGFDEFEIALGATVEHDET